MAIELISKIKQKNSGQFFLVDATDIDVKSGGNESVYPDTSLSNYLDGVSSDVEDLQTLVGDTPVSEQIDEKIAEITPIPDSEIIALFSS